MIDEVKAGHLTELLGGTRGSLSKFNKSTGDLQKAVQNSQTTLAGLAAEQVRMKKFVEKWAETLDTLKVENGLIRKDLHMAQRVC